MAEEVLDIDARVDHTIEQMEEIGAEKEGENFDNEDDEEKVPNYAAVEVESGNKTKRRRRETEEFVATNEAMEKAE